MATCPNYNSKEWKKILEESQNNKKIAMETWVKRGYNNLGSLNTEKSESELTEEERKVLTQEQLGNISKKTDLETLADKTKSYLRRRIELLKKVKAKDSRKRSEDIKKLLENMKALDEVESISLVIDDAFQKSKDLLVNMEQIVKDAEENPNRADLIDRLAVITEEVNGYSIIDEIRNNKDVVDFFEEKAEGMTDEELEQMKSINKKDPTSIKDKLFLAIANMDNLKQRVNVEALPLIADWLLGGRSSYAQDVRKDVKQIRERLANINLAFDEGRISKKQRDSSVANLNLKLEQMASVAANRDDMISTLREATREEGVLDYMIGPMITSPDSVLALFAKNIKDRLEEARLKDIEVKESISKEFIEYNSTKGLGQDNPKKFNEGLYEIIEVKTDKKDENGDWIYKEEAHFVSKYDQKKLKAFIRKWYVENPEPHKRKKYSELTAKEKAEKAAWRTREQSFYSQIYKTKSPEEIAEIDAKMQKQVEKNLITQEEFNTWKNSNDRKKQIREPIDRFLSDRWKTMYDSNDVPINAMGRYHKALTDAYYLAQEDIPESQRLGTKLPSIEKKDLERLRDEGIINLVKTNIKEAGRVRSYDTQFGDLTIQGEGAKFLPIFYTQEIDINNQSFDLASIVLLFSQMSNKYAALNQISPEITLTKSLMKDRKVPEFNQKGQRLKDSLANKFGLTEYLRQNGDSHSKKHFDAFLDMIVYGKMQEAEAIGNLSAGKITNTITGFSALTTIAADLLKGVANNLQGNIQLIIEAQGAEFFNAKQLRQGKAAYIKRLPQMLGDFGKPSPTSLAGRLNELYDPIQGNFTDKYGRLITASVANKLIRTDTLFFNQYFGEHELQVSTMYALMKATMVRDKQTKQEITLFDAHEKYGAREAFEKIEFIEEQEDGSKKYRDYTEKDRRSFQDRLHALNKKMHGVYNNLDKATVQRYSLGRLGMMYRKHMYPGYMRRFQRYRYDEELGSGTEGFYNTFFSTFMKDLVTFKRDIGKQWSTYTDHEKANIRRALTELSMIISLVILIAALSAMADSDEEIKESYLYNFIMYEAVRMRAETAQYINPADAWRTVKSPSAALSTATRGVRLLNQILPWNITEEYKRKSGIWEKGDNKAWAYFIKFIGLPGYNINPREAVKIYESITAV